jgi:NADH-quinone oxidoreductase subunit M
MMFLQVITSTLFAVTFSPLIGVVALLFTPADRKDTARWIAFSSSLVTFALSLVMLSQFDSSKANMQLEVFVPWIQVGTNWNINFHFGVDGISTLMILLTTFLVPIAVWASFSVEERVKEYMIFFLLLEVGMLGVFVSLDLFLFYIFWEFSLVPMYMLIGIWGGKRRLYAAVKFFLYTMAGSILMLLAILWLGNNLKTFDYVEILARYKEIAPAVQMWLFGGFALAFCIKVPLWPLHSWLPDAHVEAPTAGSVILAGVLLKLGTYGFLRFNLGLFPDAAHQFAPLIATLAVIGIIYGAVVSFPQKDVKKLVAYSSVSHLGFVMLGLVAMNDQGIEGAVLQMINHGISTGALFLLIGMIYERRHTRELSEFGGLWKVMPIYGAFSLIVSLSSMGLPGLNGFVGEFTILLGAFGSHVLASPWYTVFATTGVILAAVYMLWMFQKMFLGPVTNPENNHLQDLNWREIAVIVPLIVMIFVIGLYPKPFFDLMHASVQQMTAVLDVAVHATGH